MPYSDRDETKALAWLYALPRTTTNPAGDREQIIISLCPGTLGAKRGAPHVHLAVNYPGKGRLEATGNNLAQACFAIQTQLCSQGVELGIKHDLL